MDLASLGWVGIINAPLFGHSVTGNATGFGSQSVSSEHGRAGWMVGLLRVLYDTLAVVLIQLVIQTCNLSILICALLTPRLVLFIPQIPPGLL